VEQKPELSLTLLMPGQVLGPWRDVVEKAIAVGLVPRTLAECGKQVAAQLQRGRYRAYVLGARLPNVSEEQAGVALVIAYRSIDEATGEYIFYVWSLLGVDHLGEEDWAVAFRLLREEARKLNCKRINAVSDNPRVIQLVEQLGGSAEKRLLTWEI